MKLEEVEKEIESLKRKTFYLEIIIILISTSLLNLTINQKKQYSDIHDYYVTLSDANQKFQQRIAENNRLLEELLLQIR